MPLRLAPSSHSGFSQVILVVNLPFYGARLGAVFLPLSSPVFAYPCNTFARIAPFSSKAMQDVRQTRRH